MPADGALIPARARLLLSASLLALTGVVAWLVVYFRPATYAFPLGDSAFIELYTHHAARGAWALGPYSQFGWHHPGPLYFYLLAPLYRLSNERTLSLAAGAGLLNVASAAGILWLLLRWARPPVSVGISVALGIFLWRFAGLTTSTWNPHVIVLPLGLFVVLCAGLVLGRFRAAPGIALIGSFLVQTHLSTAPFVALLAGSALASAIMIVRRSRDASLTRASVRWLGAALVVLAVAWALPIAEQVTGASGNLSKIARFFVSPSPGQPWSAAARAWTESILALTAANVKLPAGWPLALAAGGWSIALAAAQVVALIVGVRSALRRGDRFDAALGVMGALASLVGLWSITQVRTAIGDYMIFWLTIVGALNWGLLAGLVVDALAARTAVAAIPWHVVARWGTAAVMAVAVWQTADHVKRGRDRALEPPVGDSRHVQVMAEALRIDLERHGKTRPLVVIASPVWGEAAGIVLRLYKLGIPVTVGGGLGPLYGPPLMPTGGEDRIFHIADVETSRALAERPHDRIVIERGRVIVHADD